MCLTRQQEFRVDSSLLDFLLLAEKRPGMYFGSDNVVDVHRTLHGWMMHRSVVGDNDPFADIFGDFHAFVADCFDDNRTSGWSAMIAENTQTDAEGFTLFMTLVKDLQPNILNVSHDFCLQALTPSQIPTRPHHL